MSFETPKVTEMGSHMESVTPFDRFGLEEDEEWRDWPQKLAENLGLNEKSPDSSETLSDRIPSIKVGIEPDYITKEQLAVSTDYITEVPVTHMLYGATRGERPGPPRTEHKPDCKSGEGSCGCGK